MAVLVLKVTTARPSAYLINQFQTAGGSRAIADRISQYIERVVSGNELAQGSSNPPSILVTNQNVQVQASGTVTFTGVGAANDTILINGVTFTAVASGATGNQWNVGE